MQRAPIKGVPGWEVSDVANRIQAMAWCRAEIEANKIDAQDYFREAVAYARDGRYDKATVIHSFGLNAIERIARWSTKLVQASSTSA